MTYFAISYYKVPITVVDMETYEEVRSRYPNVKILHEGTQKSCDKYVEENFEETDLSDYDTSDYDTSD